MDATILLVEDDKNLGFLLASQLEDEGFNVILKRDGEEGSEALASLMYDLCIFDVMLPKKDGFELVEELRESGSMIPFIFLTARSLKTDKINGYKVGADDYITKPFDVDELLYKIKAILRRAKGETKVENSIALGNSIYYINDRIYKCCNDENVLSNKEAMLIEMFFKAPNSTITKSNLLKAVWGRDDYFTAKSMEVYLTKVRKYIKGDASLELKNIHGYGYKLLVSE